jgi:hypothetical protein
MGLRLEEGAPRKQDFGFKDSFMTALAGLPFFTIPSMDLTTQERKKYCTDSL